MICNAFLSAAGVSGPYVLVGHSLGGIIIRLYAATYPHEVVGLILVDASREEQNVQFRRRSNAPEQWAAFERLQQQALSELADDPGFERMDLDASFAQLRTAVAAQPLPSLPLVVLTRGVPVSAELPPELQSELPRTSHLTRSTRCGELQAELAALAPDARHVVATKCALHPTPAARAGHRRDPAGRGCRA